MNESLVELIKEIKEKYDSLSRGLATLNSRFAEIERVIGVCTGTMNGCTVTAIHEPTFDNAHHCGEDSESEGLHQSLKDLLGMEVIGVGGKQTRCLGCPNVHNGTDCVKVELVGGTYLCLAKPRQDDAKPVINFDDENEEGLGDIMKRIEEATEVFMDYLDNITKKEE